jgi:hypothetical protein
MRFIALAGARVLRECVSAWPQSDHYVRVVARLFQKADRLVEGVVGVVGVWRFVTSVSHTEDGKMNRQSPAGATGYIIYTADGHVAYLRMRSLGPAFASGTLEGGTPEEKIAAFDNFAAYCGTYEVQDNTVVHHVEASLLPNIVGTNLVRTFSISGDELTVTTPLGPSHVTGTTHTTTLVFQRATSPVT